jgi:hypothetical protein
MSKSSQKSGLLHSIPCEFVGKYVLALKLSAKSHERGRFRKAYEHNQQLNCRLLLVSMWSLSFISCNPKSMIVMTICK